MTNEGRIITGSTNKWTNFCEDDTEEVNTMSTSQAKEIAKKVRHLNYAHYWIPDEQVVTAKEVLGDKFYDQ